MFRFKESSKGFVTIFTLLIICLIFSFIFFSLKLETMKSRYNSTWISFIEKENQLEKHRVYLFSNINQWLHENAEGEPWSLEKINIILGNSKREYYKNSFWEYDTKNKKIILCIAGDKGESVIEYYNYSIENHKLKYYLTK